MKNKENTPQLLDLDTKKHTNEDLMRNLKDHLQFLEDKHKTQAGTALLTTITAITGTTALIAGNGLAVLLNNEHISQLDVGSLATLGGLALGTSLISGIIAYHQLKKSKKYGYFRRLSEAGLESAQTLQKTKNVLKRDDSTIEEITQLVDPELAKYLKMENLSLFPYDNEQQDEDQLTIQGL